MTQVICPHCNKAIDVEGFGGAVKCPACSKYFPYGAEKRIRCPHCNKFTRIQDVRGLDYKCSHCNKSIFFARNGDIVTNISDTIFVVINLGGLIAAISMWIFAGFWVCSSVFVVVIALNAYFAAMKKENKPEKILNSKSQTSSQKTQTGRFQQIQIIDKIPFLPLMAYVANADGVINQREYDYLRWLIEMLLRNISGETEHSIQQSITDAINFINNFKNPQIDILYTIGAKLSKIYPEKVTTDFVMAMCEMCITDGEFAPREQNAIGILGQVLLLPQQTIKSIVSKYVSQGQQRTTPEAQEKYTNREAYAILGLKVGTPISEVKKRYRELAKRYHPDMQMGKSEADRMHSEEMMKTISRAFNQITQTV